MAEAMFGAGCFWGVEETFRKVPGVKDVAVGFAGGHTEQPTYKEVCTGRTGHAEVVHIDFDPAQVSYDRLLAVFFDCHDPTQKGRQGPDVGDQYRSVIFAYGDAQRDQAAAHKEALDTSGRFARPIQTTIEAASTFWRAEEYHQQYLAKARGEVARV